MEQRQYKKELQAEIQKLRLRYNMPDTKPRL